MPKRRRAARRGAADIFLRELDERREERRQLQLDVPTPPTASIGPSRATAAARAAAAAAASLPHRCRVRDEASSRVPSPPSARRGAAAAACSDGRRRAPPVGRHDIGRHTRRWLAAAQWRLGGGAKTPQVPVERSAHLFVSLRSCSVKTIRSIDAAACHAHALRTRRARGAHAPVAASHLATLRRGGGGTEAISRDAR